MSYLETKDLAVGYHGKPLIEDIALHVQRGRIVTLIGPNGSGKSTILKTIIGQLSKVSGTVFLDGKAMEERSRNEIARRMAILMTARMEPELMTCRDVVSSGRYPYYQQQLDEHRFRRVRFYGGWYCLQGKGRHGIWT